MKNFLHTLKKYFKWRDKIPCDRRYYTKSWRTFDAPAFCREESVFVEGPVIECSEKRPVTKEDILRQMHKTGNVPFILTSFEVNLDEDVFFQCLL